MAADDNLNHQEPPAENPAITVRLEAFEGPLDLLLHLIKREEIDIWNIPIARVTEQYLQYLQMMKNLNINLAAEWLVMAATLIYVKSRMLLPPDAEAIQALEATPEDPRTELVYQLLEHQKFKNAAQMLYTREEVENAVWNKPPREALDDESEVVAVSLFDLLGAFHEVVRRFEAEQAMQMQQEEVTVEQKMSEVRHLLLVHDTILFSTFFAHARSRQHLIVTFLALLELVRMREIWLYQKRNFDEIYITKGKMKSEKG